VDLHRWIVVADSPFLPARGGGEREHLGFVRAAAAAGSLTLLVVPTAEHLDAGAYASLVGNTPILTTPRRKNPLLLARPVRPFVVSSRPVPTGIVARARVIAPDATGVVVFSYKSWRIGQALAQGLDLPAVLRQHNLEGSYHHSLAAGTRGVRRLVLHVEASRINRDERRLEQAPWLKAIADISAYDAEFRRRRGAPAVHVPPFAFDEELLRLPRRPDSRRVILFLGALDVATNTTALDWFLRGPWPLIRRLMPDAVFQVVGRRPSPALRARLAAEAGVELHSDVADLTSYLSAARLAVNPAVSGSGVNIKLIDYLQAGLPVVSTTLGARGILPTARSEVEVADRPDDFARAVTHLLIDPVYAEDLGARGRRQVTSQLQPSANIRLVEECFLRTVSHAPPARPARSWRGRKRPRKEGAA
jgi:polysaccharide biosynthesis protein PslH